MGPSKIQGFDEEEYFVHDLRLARRWKRRRIADQTFKLKYFSDGTPRKTIYDSTDIADFKLNSDRNRAPTKTINKDNSYNNQAGHEIDVDYMCFLNLLGSYGDIEGEVENHIGCVDIDNGDGDYDNNDGSAGVDPQYKMFLDNIKEDGKSFVLQVSLNDEISMLLKYEEDCGYKAKDLGATENSPMKKDKKYRRIFRSASKRMRTDCQKRSINVLGKQKIDGPRASGDMLGNESLKTKKNLSNNGNRKRKSPMVKKNSRVEDVDPSSSWTNEHMFERPTGNFHSLKHNCDRKVNYDEMRDADYDVFLSRLEKEDDVMVFTDKRGQKVIYDNDAETSLDPKVNAMDESPLIDEKTVIPSRSCEFSAIKCCGSSQPTFREKLMDVLKKPYDDKEYEDLWKEVCRRRPMERHRESRSGQIKPCILSSPGRSYLDLHKPLAKEVKRAGHDRPKILYLLRGFFFWLQYLTLEGAFTPWCDKKCLKMMPS